MKNEGMVSKEEYDQYVVGMSIVFRVQTFLREFRRTYSSELFKIVVKCYS